ncbi:MAG: hypothetical protein JST54_10285 [Deltaproteobacteria bacterium]|nr:hypothetical protein [Deltaproteobacteria bacterium]
MNRAICLALLLVVGCSQGSDAQGSLCPLPVDGGKPGGACREGSATCEFWTEVLVPGTGGCGNNTEYQCTCDAGAWSCIVEGIDHHVCDYPDGGPAY